MTRHLYPHGEHPFWCELLEADCGTNDDPHHLGRTSTMFAQSDEVRMQLQLVRPDQRVPAGTVPGEVRAKLTTDAGLERISVWLNRHEAETLANLLAQYVDFIDRETKFGDGSTSAEILRREMYAGDRR